MLTSIRDCKYSTTGRQWIEYVYGEYLEALGDAIAGQANQDEISTYWFSNPYSHPLLILKGPDPVGFALVTRPRPVPGIRKSFDHMMAEFFIRKQYRRRSIGREAAYLIFDRFAGDWEILQYQQNKGAIGFWRSVIAAYSGGHYSERVGNGEIRQRFRSEPPRRNPT